MYAEKIKATIETAVINETALLFIYPNFSPKKTKIKENSDTCPRLAPLKNEVRFLNPIIPIAIITINGFRTKAISEKAMTANQTEPKPLKVIFIPRMTKKIMIKKSLKIFALAIMLSACDNFWAFLLRKVLHIL